MKRKLEAMMKLHGDTGTDLAKVLGIARSTFSLKLNEVNGSEFTKGEITKIKDRYDLTAKEVVDIFFSSEVSKKTPQRRANDRNRIARASSAHPPAAGYRIDHRSGTPAGRGEVPDRADGRGGERSHHVVGVRSSEE